jgi:transcriptional regulator with XRE-family HTH domain
MNESIDSQTSQTIIAAAEATCTASVRDIIRARRRELHLTQSDVAHGLGFLSPEFISMCESGRRAVELNKIPKLAEILRLDPVNLCRLALTEAAPLMAIALFGRSPANPYAGASARGNANP